MERPSQHLKNICIYNTCSSNQADHQADDEAEKKKPTNIPSKQNGDAEIKDVIGARKHKEDEVLTSSSSFLNVPTMRKRQTDLKKRHTKIKVMGYKSAKSQDLLQILI